jgi:dTMP kinase
VLIAVEGIDQAGKRTQAQLLARMIRKVGNSVSVWSFPVYTTPLGRQLRSYLQGRFPLEARAVHLLYAANKWEVAEKMTHRLRRGEVIVVNRYTPSNLAYGLAHGLPQEWLASLEKGLPEPDMVILLDIPPRASNRRKRKDRDIHEANLHYLAKVRREYLHLAEKFGWTIVNGQMDVESVRAAVWGNVAPIFRPRS